MKKWQGIGSLWALMILCSSAYALAAALPEITAWLSSSVCAQVSSQGDTSPASPCQVLDPNTGSHITEPNDAFFPSQWHLSNTGQTGGTPGADINVLEAWQITTGNPDIVIAVLDSGIDPNHPDLINNMVPGYDFVQHDDDPKPREDRPFPNPNDGHGTLMAGIAAAEGNNGIGVIGVAPNCKIMPIRIYSGRRGLIGEDDLAEALRWAARNGADVISNSWGLPLSSTVLHAAVQDVTMPGGIGRGGKGCVVVWAVDARGRRIRSTWQEAYEEVIAVGAVDHNDQRWHFSDYGPELDIMAPSGAPEGEFAIWTTDILGYPGVSVFNEDPNLLDYTDKAWGTSPCAPMVAGVAALMLSVDPNLTNEEVRRILLDSAQDLGEPGRDDYYGWGRVDARRALKLLQAEHADLNKDDRVNFQDFALLGQLWPESASLDELVLLMDHWLHAYGLISHWPLDESKGPSAWDAVTHNQGALHGKPIWQPEAGRVQGALAFDGVDDYVRVRAPLNPEDGPFSVFVWIKGSVTGQTILAQEGGAVWLSVDLQFGHLRTDLVGTEAQAMSLQADEPTLTDDNWHYVGFTWDGSVRALYVDGLEVASDMQSQLAGSDGDLFIGAGPDRGANSYWYGLIDDVRIYNRALSAQEIAALAY